MGPVLSIVFCTKNRPNELWNAINAVFTSARHIPAGQLQCIFIDDGKKPAWLDHFLEKESDRHENIKFNYHNKADTPGLFRSRIIGVNLAESDLILFLDDDVEINPDYLPILLDCCSKYPEAMGYGGIDDLLPAPGLLHRLYEILFMIRSTKPGQLSPSGFGGSMDTWSLTRQPFRSAYLSGCNMAFRKCAVDALEPQSWFKGYSLGEDLYLCYEARKSGDLIVYPNMKVKHFRSPLGRESAMQSAADQVINHFYLLKIYRAPFWRFASLLFTAIGFFLRYLKNSQLSDPDQRQLSKAQVQGSLSGIKSMIKLWRTRAQLP